MLLLFKIFDWKGLRSSKALLMTDETLKLRFPWMTPVCLEPFTLYFGSHQSHPHQDTLTSHNSHLILLLHIPLLPLICMVYSVHCICVTHLVCMCLSSSQLNFICLKNIWSVEFISKASHQTVNKCEYVWVSLKFIKIKCFTHSISIRVWRRMELFYTD